MTSEKKLMIRRLLASCTFDEIAQQTQVSIGEIEVIARENLSRYQIPKLLPQVNFRIPLEVHLINNEEDFVAAFSQRYTHDAMINLYRHYLNQCEGDCKECEFIFDIRHMYHRICDEYRDMITGLCERLGKTEEEFFDIGHWTLKDLQTLFGHRHQ